MKILARTNHASSPGLVNVILFLCGVLFLGCSQPLRTLMAVGAEQKAQQAQVARSDLRFDALVKDIKSGRLLKGTSLMVVYERYGSPVIIKEEEEGAKTFLYRRRAVFLGTPKVYLDFDSKGILTDMRIVTEGG